MLRVPFFFLETTMRINGRTLRPSDLAERRVLLALGVNPVLGLKVPRTENPYMIARRIRRIAAAQNEDMQVLRALVSNSKHREPRPNPELDVPTPIADPGDIAAA